MFGGSLKTLEAIRDQRFPSPHTWERQALLNSRVFFNSRVFSNKR